MSRRGVWQLQKMIIQYCDKSGSSRGTREFINHWLPRFREENPQFEIEETMKRGRHPYLDAKYRNGRQRTVSLRNDSPEEILRQAVLLRSNTGRKTTLQVKQRTTTKRPSIQGAWTPELQAKLVMQTE